MIRAIGLAEITFTQVSLFEIILFSIGVIFTLILLGIFIFIFTRKEEDRESLG